MISRATMDEHVAAGRAQRWTHELGPGRLVPQAVLLDGTWFTVSEGEDDFQEASAELAAELTTGLTAATSFDALFAAGDLGSDLPTHQA
ncbi:hypothetical protein [Lentzea sp. NPDC092896]|uniref:hypothetical protein n=1 Tax=Lentzea sp. NPDC092896 TaxID=3364127 RepID=UPI00382DB1C6